MKFLLPHRVSALADLLLFCRNSLSDGVYSVPTTLIRAAGNSRARVVGYLPGMKVRWAIDHHANVQADYRVFYASPFLRQTISGGNLNYLSFWVGYKF